MTALGGRVVSPARILGVPQQARSTFPVHPFQGRTWLVKRRQFGVYVEFHAPDRFCLWREKTADIAGKFNIKLQVSKRQDAVFTSRQRPATKDSSELESSG